jgi:hypothetical protein
MPPTFIHYTYIDLHNGNVPLINYMIRILPGIDFIKWYACHLTSLKVERKEGRKERKKEREREKERKEKKKEIHM